MALVCALFYGCQEVLHSQRCTRSAGESGHMYTVCLGKDNNVYHISLYRPVVLNTRHIGRTSESVQWQVLELFSVPCRSDMQADINIFIDSETETVQLNGKTFSPLQ